MSPTRTSVPFALTAIMGALLLSQHAAAASPDHLDGQVVRAKDGRPLAGATVLVRGTDRTTRTGADGHFVIDGLPAQALVVEVSADGMQPLVRDLPFNHESTLNMAMETSMSALETIVVDAQRVPNDVARAAQQESLNFINVTTAEEIRKLPDVNAGEALARVPGISLETDTGEGRFINIRGLTSDLNATTFGGLRLPPSNPASPFSGGRAVAYDAIPTGLVGALTVTKTNLPEQDAEALGGTIEITPKTAPRNGRPFVEGHLGTGHETLRNTGIQDYSVTAGTRFGGDGTVATDHAGNDYRNRPFSIVVSASYYEDKRGIDDIEAGYVDNQSGGVPDKAFSAFEQRYYQYNRKRHGYGFDLGYEPDSHSRYYLRAFDAGYTESVNRQRLVWNFDGNATLNPASANGLLDTVNGAGWDKTLRNEKERIDNKVAALGGENRYADGTIVDFRLGYTKGSYDKFYDLNADFNNTPATSTTVAYNNISDPNFPTFNVVSGANPSTWSNYTLVGFRNSTETLSDHENSLVGNVSVPTHLSGADDEHLKAGVSARLRKRSDVQPQYTYTGFPTPSLSSLASGDVSFYGGRYNNGPQINADAVSALFNNGQSYATLNTIATAQSATSGSENVYAVYGQYEMSLGKLSLVSGLRLEQTHATYGANAVNTDTNTVAGQVTQSTSYTNLFPSIQGRYELGHALIARAAFSSTIARPGFGQVNPAMNISPSTDTVSFGNPNVKPTTSNNIDLSIEHYLPNAGILSLGVFDKEITDFIAQIQTSQTFPNSGLFAGFVGPAHVTTYANIPTARAFGLETSYEQRYRKLPGFWSGLGTSVNWTYVSSSGQFRSGVTQTLPSTSRNTANAQLFYEKDGLNLRASVYYVSRDLFGFGGSTATDVYSEARTTADLGGSLALNKNLSVYVNAKNVTNAPLKFTEGTSNRPIQREFYGPTYQLGIRFDY
jgi:TonB-dependent receptor